MMDFNALSLLAAGIVHRYSEAGKMIATAESCTGGLVAGLLTEVPGSSAVVERGFITYSNEAKTELLGVPEELITKHGAVSEPVARAMAKGALEHSRADIAVSITGVAGPGGGSPDKPVGTVHFACATKDRPIVHRRAAYGDDARRTIRFLSVAEAFNLLDAQLVP